MSNQVQINGLFLNLIIYVIMILPIIFILLKESIYKTKEKFAFWLVISVLIEIVLSILFHKFSRNIFSIFTNTKGVINYAVYSSKILFISSSLYNLKFLLPAYISKKDSKKTVILVFSKITVNLIFILIGYTFFNTKGILYSFPICDIIYYIIYVKVFLNIFRQNI